ncbi:MAG: response regulator [Candidatus Omnitrophota bacterium]|nr:MAG: response regulator [Candidatus Omnitrophota bacterium]
MAKLLIVDDEADVREFAANFFRRRKIDVFTAGNGEEAINIAEGQKPNLILLDIKMEGVDGIQVLERIRQKDSSVKVIMVTGTKPEENETFAKCLQLGATNYIHKPLQLDELEKIVLKELN